MSARLSKNVPASIRQRLLNRAKSDHRPFSELLQYYAMERFLYRLSLSPHVRRFVLKGALMLRAWNLPEFRSTMDIDLLGKTRNEAASIVAQIKEILAVEVSPDGLTFDVNSIETERITPDADYEGLRIRFKGELDSARVVVQIDIGFGDVVFPGPQPCTLPSLLDSPAPQLMGYSRESAIAEKFESMVRHRELNSRMKDFYDIWLLSRQFNFEGARLSEAIRLTFDSRSVSLSDEIVAFTAAFTSTKQSTWTAFRKRLKQDSVPISFAEVVAVVEAFVAPPVSAIVAGKPVPSYWNAPGPWR
jgi:hypothetical protein